MENEIINGLGKIVELSKQGIMRCLYTNNLITISFLITDKLKGYEEDDMFMLYCFKKGKQPPVELQFKADDIASIYYVGAGSTEECSVPSAMIKFKDGAECKLYQAIA